MSLHDQILDGLGDIPPYHAVLGALRAVVELHAPRPCRGMDGDLCMHLDPHNLCSTCGTRDTGRHVIGDPDSTARCPTVQAVARELGIEATDRA